MRITKTSSTLTKIKRGKNLEITINGKKVQAFEGELVSTVLMEEGLSVFHRKENTGRPSGLYCGMGVCYECLVRVDGVDNVRACQTMIQDQMVIETGQAVTV